MKILSAIFWAILFPICVLFGVLFLMYIGYEIWQRLTAIYDWIKTKFLTNDNVVPVLILLIILMLAFIGGKFGYMWEFGAS